MRSTLDVRVGSGPPGLWVLCRVSHCHAGAAAGGSASRAARVAACVFRISGILQFSRPLIGGLYIDPPHRFIRVNAGGAGGGGAAGRGRDASGEGVGRRAAPGARRSSYPTLETSRLPWFLHPRRIKAPWENSSPRPFGFTLYQVEPLFNGG